MSQHTYHVAQYEMRGQRIDTRTDDVRHDTRNPKIASIEDSSCNAMMLSIQMNSTSLSQTDSYAPTYLRTLLPTLLYNLSSSIAANRELTIRFM